MAAAAYKNEARLRQLLVGGEIFLGSALSASLTKMTLRAMDLLGESSPAAKEMQVCACRLLVRFVRSAFLPGASFRRRRRRCWSRLCAFSAVTSSPGRQRKVKTGEGGSDRRACARGDETEGGTRGPRVAESIVNPPARTRCVFYIPSARYFYSRSL